MPISSAIRAKERRRHKQTWKTFSRQSCLSLARDASKAVQVMFVSFSCARCIKGCAGDVSTGKSSH
jgi:hypothetical protein